MKNFILFDDSRNNLLPLAFTRPVAEFRVGILTIREKWEKYLSTSVSWLTEDYLSAKFPIKKSEENIFINGSIIPDEKLIKAILALKNSQHLVKANIVVAASCDKSAASYFINDIGKVEDAVQYSDEIFKINNLWDIFKFNQKAIELDFELITKGRKSAPISKTNQLVAPGKIFFEEGAKAEFSILNASSGPIYLGNNAEIMEGCLVRGGLALCEHSTLKLGAKIYGPTTIGPHSKFGGETNNSVIFGFSNKAHDGFLGNSVLGEWCNLGADTNTSNLKNNYAEIKLWNYSQGKFISTGQQFLGMIIGDHSKCGINTMFNSGTVVGVSSNIFGAGYPRNFIPSFSWGGPQGMSVYPFDKAIETVEKVYQRRKLVLSDQEREILKQIFIETEKYRRF